MLKFTLFLLILLSQVALAQDLSRDLEFIETQNTQGNPNIFPVYMGLDGSIAVAGIGNPNPIFNFQPTFQVAWKKTESHYIKPVQVSGFSFSEQKTGLGWLQVKRLRYEFGLGLGATVAQNIINVGLTPFKGARQVMIRQVSSRDEKTPAPKLPKTLEELNDWKTGDQGSFQRYGGVQLAVGAGYFGINIITGDITLQNLFSVVLNKISDRKVSFSISEEDLTKRRLSSGIFLANVKLNFFDGKRFTATFTLDLDNPEHHQLYEEALRGKIKLLQSKLPEGLQKLEWKGSEKMGYVGIPGTAGIYFQRSEYKMNFDGEEDIIDIKTRRASGLFVPLRMYNKLVYQSEKAILLFWFSEMNNVTAKMLNEKFLVPGNIMGAKGFDSEIPEGTLVGSTLAQMGMSFTREELEAITPEIMEEIFGHFKDRCEEMNLSCAKEKRFNKIVKKLKKFKTQTWAELRDDLGFLMIEEPALIYSYIKAIKSKKKVYFKFLNEKYQSLEGAAAIET